MKVFLSWSGNSSRLVAQVLRDWLPNVLQTIEPWLSSDDIPLGDRWQAVISKALEGAAVGIICLTRENLGAIWLSFEAGALAKANSLVCPFLLDVEPSEVKGPLMQFQFARADRQDTHRLVHSLNKLSGSGAIPERILDRAFELHWPSLESRLGEIRRVVTAPESGQTVEQKMDEALRLLRGLTERGLPEPAAAATEVKDPSNHKTVTPGVGALIASGFAPTITVSKVPRGKPRVFVGSSTEGLQVAEFIQLGLEQAAECTLWTQSTFAPGQTTIESIVDVAVEYDFAVLVLTADDMTVKRGVEAAGPRDNVVFELGLFTGALGRARTFMVYSRDENLRLPSDLNGVTAVMYGNRSDGNLEAALGPVCTRIKQAMGVAQDRLTGR